MLLAQIIVKKKKTIPQKRVKAKIFNVFLMKKLEKSFKITGRFKRKIRKQPQLYLIKPFK